MVRYTKRQSQKKRQQYYCANKNKALEQKRENYECNADIRKDADKQAYRTNAEKKKYALKKAYSINADGVKSAAKTRYASNPEAKKEAVKARYASNPEAQKGAVKARYASNPEGKKEAEKTRYASNPKAQKEAVKARYASNPKAKKEAVKARYASNPKAKKEAVKARYASNPEGKKEAVKARYASNPKAKKEAVKARYASNPEPKKEVEKARYASNPESQKEAVKARYASNPKAKKEAVKARYASNPEAKKEAVKARYASNPKAKKEAVKARYASNPKAKKEDVKARYASNPEPKKRAVSKRYTTNPEANFFLHRQWYSKYCSAVLQKQSRHYYASIKRRRAARLLRHAVNRSRDNAKNKLYRNQNKKRIVIEKTAKRARYVLTEPKTDVKEKYVQNMKTKIHSKPTLKRKLLHAFRSSRKPLADKIKPSKLCNAVSNIAARKLLNKVLKVRKQSVGELLSCIRSVTALKISTEDLGKSRHTASSEPFFYDQSYAMVRHTSPIAVDSHGRCVIAEEEGKRNEKSNRPKCWKCTAECKLPTPREVRSIMSTKALFEQPVQKLREALNTIDECTEHGHYSRPLNVLNSKGETLYYELAGHPLPCTSDCQSSLRVLRAAATHFPQLRRLVCLLYDAIRQHRLLESIDTALCAGDLEKLLKLCAVSYDKLFRSIDSNEDSCGTADSEVAVHQPIRLQQPKLPDLESHLHVEHAQVIADIEKKVF